MADIPLAGAIGDLFNRLGKIAYLLEQLRSYQNSQETALTDTTSGIVAQLDAESDIQGIVGTNYVAALNAAGAIGSLASQLAVAVINRMVFRASPRIGQTLTTQNTLASVQEVIRQMQIQGQTVLAPTVTVTPGSFQGGVGNGTLNASALNYLGKTLENSFAETVQVLCNSDSYTGGATAGNEGFAVTGTGAETDYFAFDWPLGSGASTSLNAIDGTQDNASGNLLTNSDWEDWDVHGVPDNWTLVTGVAGTNILEETGNIYVGSSCLAILGGAALTELKQEFNTSDGTLGQLSPLTPYSVNIYVRRDGTAPAAGVLAVDLVDENNNPILDQAGNTNSFTIDLTQLTVYYAAYSGTFRTPQAMPSRQFLRLRLTTALTSERQVYLDDLSIGTMTQLANSMPYFAVHAGSVPFGSGTYAECVVTNSRGVGGTLDTFQTVMARLLPQIMFPNELLLPSSSSPTITDSTYIN